jgi:hypothetical protein
MEPLLRRRDLTDRQPAGRSPLPNIHFHCTLRCCDRAEDCHPETHLSGKTFEQNRRSTTQNFTGSRLVILRDSYRQSHQFISHSLKSGLFWRTLLKLGNTLRDCFPFCFGTDINVHTQFHLRVAIHTAQCDAVDFPIINSTNSRTTYFTKL